MDGYDAIASDKDELPFFKLLGCSTTKAGINVTRELKEQKDGNQSDISDVVSDMLSHNQNGGREYEGEAWKGYGVRVAIKAANLRKRSFHESVVAFANISKAVKADTKKGTEVKQQQVWRTFDRLLGVSSKLQKAIVATTSLPAASQPASRLQPVPETSKAAEDAALNLRNILTDLLYEPCSPSTPEQEHNDIDVSTPS
ncbi:hypothetical protein HOY80DRAFT_1068952 [Tuber brumale]|nr:hypothetical protein HOY80DRAFT_1068952 [Tuber brumale]